MGLEAFIKQARPHTMRTFILQEGLRLEFDYVMGGRKCFRAFTIKPETFIDVLSLAHATQTGSRIGAYGYERTYSLGKV